MRLKGEIADQLKADLAAFQASSLKAPSNISAPQTLIDGLFSHTVGRKLTDVKVKHLRGLPLRINNKLKGFKID